LVMSGRNRLNDGGSALLAVVVSVAMADWVLSPCEVTVIEDIRIERVYGYRIYPCPGQSFLCPGTPAILTFVYAIIGSRVDRIRVIQSYLDNPNQRSGETYIGPGICSIGRFEHTTVRACVDDVRIRCSHGQTVYIAPVRSSGGPEVTV
jgi:hypothetical protein